MVPTLIVPLLMVRLLDPFKLSFKATDVAVVVLKDIAEGIVTPLEVTVPVPEKVRLPVCDHVNLDAGKFKLVTVNVDVPARVIPPVVYVLLIAEASILPTVVAAEIVTVIEAPLKELSSNIATSLLPGAVVVVVPPEAVLQAVVEFQFAEAGVVLAPVVLPTQYLFAILVCYPCSRYKYIFIVNY